MVNHKFLTVAKRTLLRPGIYLYQTNWGWISRWHCSPSWGCSAQHCVAPDTSRIFEHLYPNIIHKPWLRWQCRVPQQRQKSSTTDIQWRRLLRARGPCVKQQTIHWLNCGGQHEKAKSGGARQKFFNGTSSRTCALCPSPTVTFVMAPLNIAEADNGQR